MTVHAGERTKYDPHEKVLLVEGATEMRLLPWLMEANGVLWPKQVPVQIRDKNGYDNILKQNVVNTEIRESRRRITGILLDADEDAEHRWRSIRNLCSSHFPELVERQFGEPVIVANSDGRKLGIWIMPDNKSQGILETLLQFFVKQGTDAELLSFAKAASMQAVTEYKAPFKPSHFDKACIHTWLAWQDEPGRQLHDAVKFGILQPTSPHAQPFVRWFRELFEV